MKDRRALGAKLRAIVGRRHLLMSRRATLRYRRGYRSPPGNALAVARPGSLVELWRVVMACVDADVAILIQAANTGLTGGSNPRPDCDREMVVVNTMRLSTLHLLDDGRQVVCLPGVTLHQLERALRAIGRDPHSVIGSSCFGASVVGGVCNNSGGALVQRGPAYTELSLFGQVDAGGRLRLVNRLGIDLSDDPEVALAHLEAGHFDPPTGAGDELASDREYAQRVREIDEPTPARFNSDPRRLREASGCAGRVVVFAVRLDTFPRQAAHSTFYIGTNDPGELTALRRSMLSGPVQLPISAEYLHRETFDVAARYGRDTFVLIRTLGTDRLPRLFALKAWLDNMGAALGVRDLSERLLQKTGGLLPQHLPKRLRQWRDLFEHHLILTVGASEVEATRALLGTVFARATGAWIECSDDEAEQASLHRFVAAGAAVRMAAVERRRVSGIVALDVALPRSSQDWFGALPAQLEGQVVAILRYGHFFCHVFHRDYLVAKGSDLETVKQQLLAALEAEGAEYPAEHNVGCQYRAKPALADFYRQLDPTNRFNPGIGRTPSGPHWT